MFRKHHGLMAIVMFLMNPASGDILPGNFLPNPSVEEDADGNGVPDGWLLGGNDPVGDVWDTSMPVSGQYNLLLEDMGDANYTSWYTNVDLPRDAAELEFQWTWKYLFTSDLPSDTFRMTVAWRSGGSDISYNHVTVHEDLPEYRTENVIYPIPDGADALRLEFVSGGPQTETGSVHVDDISIAVPGQLIPGDFSQNGVLDAADIDLLSAEVRAGSNRNAFDLNADQKADARDRRVWVEQLRRTCFGDSNLDLEFSSADFVLVFQAGQYEDAAPGNSRWATGDWDGDAEFNSGDFVFTFQDGAYETGPCGAPVPVPEPAGRSLAILAALGYRGMCRDRRELFCTT